jgi:hypothetical protein
MGVPTPTFIPEPFADLAASDLVNFPIPDLPPGSPANAASWSQGFPSITMQPEVSGGLPPLGQDFNGILQTITQAICALQAGQPYEFNSSYSTAIGGYDKGALLGMGDGTGLWINALTGNETNPDDDAHAANWVPGISIGIAAVASLTGGTVTAPPSVYRRYIITLAGTLSSNLNYVLPANASQQWLIVNNTTGAYTTTVKTPSGTGVAIPQGGPSSPIGVWCDGSNLNPTVAPLSVPIAQAATPLTLAQRNSAGALFATYFNQSSSPTENPAIGSVAVQNTANDGYYRFASLTFFKQTIFASPALTGTPTAPTASVGDASTKLATTAFVNPGASLVQNGYQKFPSGLIVQWGYTQANGTTPQLVHVTFPIAFPHAAFIGLAVTKRSTSGAAGTGQVSSLTTSGMNVVYDSLDGLNNVTNGGYWIAIGN